jgi:hypothetical protein
LDNPDFCEAAKQHGFDIRLICQPPNSPDFNILDLGFFRAIQAIQYKKNTKTVEDLVPAVQQVNSSINSLDFIVLHFGFLLTDAFFNTCFAVIHGVQST